MDLDGVDPIEHLSLENRNACGHRVLYLVRASLLVLPEYTARMTKSEVDDEPS